MSGRVESALLFQFQVKAKLKVKLLLITPWKHAGRTEVRPRSFLTSTQERGEWTTSRPGRFIPGKEHGTHWTAGWVDPNGGLGGLWRRDLFRLRDSNPRPSNPQRSHYNHYAMPASFNFNNVLIQITVKKQSVSAVILYNALPLFLKKIPMIKNFSLTLPILKKQWKDENLKYN
jgi:hypothetical protein